LLNVVAPFGPTCPFEDDATDEMDKPEFIRIISSIGNKGSPEQETVQAFLLLLSILSTAIDILSST
jgi:hypothetical protein